MKKIRISLKIQIILWLTLFVLIVMTVTGAYIVMHRIKTLFNETSLNARLVNLQVSTYGKTAITEKDSKVFTGLVKNAVRDNKAAYMVITDNKGALIASNIDKEELKKIFNVSDKAGKIKFAGTLKETTGGKKKSFSLQNEELIITKNIKLGNIYFGLTDRGAEVVINGVLRDLGIATVLILVLVIAAAFMLMNFLVKPINLLVSGTKEIGKGNFDASVNIRSRNEFRDLADSFNEMAANLKEKEMLKGAFSSYVSEELIGPALSELKSGGIKLTGEKRKIAVLFSDIRDFTGISEKLEPEKVVAMLNEYFTEMTEIIQQNRGMVNKFMGDAVMAVFGAPVPAENSSLLAVESAVQMIKSIEMLNQKFKETYDTSLRIGIGINTGEVIVGNIGSKKHLEYTVIGDPVNIASRIEKLNKKYKTKILISEYTYGEIKDKVHARDIGLVPVYNRDKPVHIYEVIDFV